MSKILEKNIKCTSDEYAENIFLGQTNNFIIKFVFSLNQQNESHVVLCDALSCLGGDLPQPGAKGLRSQLL